MFTYTFLRVSKAVNLFRKEIWEGGISSVKFPGSQYSPTAIEWRVDALQVSSSAHRVMQTLKGAFYIYASPLYFIYWRKNVCTYLLWLFLWLFYNHGSQMYCQHVPSRFFPYFSLRVQFEITENAGTWCMTWI